MNNKTDSYCKDSARSKNGFHALYIADQTTILKALLLRSVADQLGVQSMNTKRATLLYML